MEKDFGQLPHDFQAFLNPENIEAAIAQAQETLNNPEKIQEVLEKSGIPSEAMANPELLLKITQDMVKALDPEIKKSLSSFVDQVLAGAPTPPPQEIQGFLQDILVTEDGDK
ncbi:MAG: hypothetical protein GX062_02555 [Firmicutes bacterium]|jgi:hypothetical protein|nr:hypothetical protein [Bacillota bacterium]